jgi:hypothetical protein
MNSSTGRLGAPLRLFLVAVLLSFAPARASTMGAPDSDSALLAAMLLQAVSDSAQLGQVLTTAQSALETARFSLDAARSATEVVSEFVYLSQNPDEVFDATASAFAQVFPQVQAIAEDAEAIRENFSGNSQGRLNPYALQQFFQNINSADGSAYQTIVAMDESVYGLTKEHLVTAELMQSVQTTSEAIRKESMLAMTPQSAAAVAAKAGAQAAVSAAVTATNVAELLRIQKATYMKSIESAAFGAASMTSQFEAFRATLEQTDPNLNPTDPSINGAAPSRGLQ